MKLRAGSAIGSFLRAVVVSAVALVVLTGCDTFLPDPVSYTLIEGEPVARICIPLTVTDIRIKTYANPDDYTGRISWAASGSHYFEAGSELVLGQGFEGLPRTSDSGENFLSGRFAVEMEVSSSEGGDWTMFSILDGADFQEGKWLDGDGDSTSTPCVRGECPRFSACFNKWPIPTGYPTEPTSTFTPGTPLPDPTEPSPEKTGSIQVPGRSVGPWVESPTVSPSPSP